MSRRLPIAGATPRPRSNDDLGDLLPKGARAPLPLPTLALVDATPGAGAERLASAFVEALEEHGLRAEVVRAVDVEEGSVEGCFAQLQEVDIVVALGAQLPRTYSPQLTLVLTGGQLPVAWSTSARALRGRFDGEIGGFRPAFARALAREWASLRIRDGSVVG